MPFLIDHKYYGQTGEGTQLEIPEADVAIVSGGVRTEEQKEILQKIREKCKTLVALGTCAINGGIPAMDQYVEKGKRY
ncbi:NADH ubiquinone oxidoreductase, 20 Kd subunit [Candidatus Methanoperedenaceae archaeon GB37]|nr:NADH ubiquinone oxidoreductase, 20 Kd subunit [Candidatus Methanoperedenaceae archaeon GB37]